MNIRVLGMPRGNSKVGTEFQIFLVFSFTRFQSFQLDTNYQALGISQNFEVLNNSKVH